MAFSLDLGNLCECGCGGLPNKGKRFIHGHYVRIHPPMKGKHLSKSMRDKISRTRKMKKIPAWNKGVPRTDEVKAKLRLADKSYLKTKAYRQKMSEVKKGHFVSDETKEKMRQAALGRHFSKEHCLNISKSRKGKSTGPLSLRRKREISRRMQACWNDPKFRAKRLRCLKVGHCEFPNKPERKLRSILRGMFPGEYKYVGDGKVWINGKNPDFINVNGQKKIIELFGDYWHSEASTGIPEDSHEQRRIRVFSKYGYETLIVWQKELKHIPALRRKLKLFHKGVSPCS